MSKALRARKREEQAAIIAREEREEADRAPKDARGFFIIEPRQTAAPREIQIEYDIAILVQERIDSIEMVEKLQKLKLTKDELREKYPLQGGKTLLQFALDNKMPNLVEFILNQKVHEVPELTSELLYFITNSPKDDKKMRHIVDSLIHSGAQITHHPGKTTSSIETAEARFPLSFVARIFGKESLATFLRRSEQSYTDELVASLPNAGPARPTLEADTVVADDDFDLHRPHTPNILDSDYADDRGEGGYLETDLMTVSAAGDSPPPPLSPVEMPDDSAGHPLPDLFPKSLPVPPFGSRSFGLTGKSPHTKPTSTETTRDNDPSGAPSAPTAQNPGLSRDDDRFLY